MYENHLLKIQTAIYKEIAFILRSNLKLFSFVGSSSTQTFIDGWSDIDILLVINHYNDEQIFKVYEFIKESSRNSSIKIGISLFSIEEIKENRVDNKNLINFHFIQTGELIPQYVSEGFELDFFSIEEHINREKAMRAYYLSLIKRIIYTDERTVDTRKFLKYCINVIKIDLIEKGILVRTYDELICEMKKYKNPSIQRIIDIIIKIPSITYDDVCMVAKYTISNVLKE